MKLPISTVRLILQKRSEGESFRTIARSLNISKSVIGKILDKASGKHLLNEEVKLDAISDSELQKLFYPTKIKPLIDWADIDEQMQRPRSNLQLLHYRLVTTTPDLEISYPVLTFACSTGNGKGSTNRSRSSITVLQLLERNWKLTTPEICCNGLIAAEK